MSMISDWINEVEAHSDPVWLLLISLMELVLGCTEQPVDTTQGWEMMSPAVHVSLVKTIFIFFWFAPDIIIISTLTEY